MIDRRELLVKAQERHLNLNLVEKDYVLGWLLFGFARINLLVFKGGTALSKIYFPEIWRLSEDLDFSLLDDDFTAVVREITEIFKLIEKQSGIKLNLKSKFSNPDYLQLKIQYIAVMGRNWIKVDVTKNDLVLKPSLRTVKRIYSDYTDFKVKVERLEEIFCSKIRSVIERKKCRDFFDLWKLMSLPIKFKTLNEIIGEKLKIKGIELKSIDQIFPKELKKTLEPYWGKELGRLVSSLPDLDLVLKESRIFFEEKLSLI